MAEKKVYFFSVVLKRRVNDTICRERILGERFKSIIDSKAKELSDKQYINKKYKILDITEKDDIWHNFIEVIIENELAMFLRLTKQQSRNNYRGRDYTDFKGTNLLPGNDESINGIEGASYAYLDFEQQIIEVISTNLTPGEKALSKAFKLYDDKYYIDFVSIPNEDSVEELYNSNNSYIRRLELDIPRPNIGYLSEILNWDSERIADVISADNLKVSLVLGSSGKGGYIADNEEKTKGLINFVRRTIDTYSRAVAYGKKAGKTSDLRKYDFIEKNFSYSINVSEKRQENRKVIALSLSEIMKSYYNQMKKCFDNNVNYFKLFLEERDE